MIEICAVPESVVEENGTFSSYEVEYAATSGVEEAFCGEETSGEVGHVLLEPAQLRLLFPDRQSDLHPCASEPSQRPQSSQTPRRRSPWTDEGGDDSWACQSS